MGLSEFCIRRPVFTTLLMAALLVAGMAGYRTLPVSALPNVDFPTIQVSANLEGASPETMASTVATPLEREFSTISGISSMTSSSTLGRTSITLQFDLGRNIDGAALDVQTAISTTLRRLPKEMTTPPSFRKVNPADAPVLYIAVSSDTLPLSKVDQYADTVMAQRISMVNGVAQALIYGEQKYALRIQVNPDKMAAQDLGFNEVQQAVAAAASNAPLGSIYGPRQLFNIDLKGQPTDAAGFRRLIALWKNGAPIRLGDLGSVVDSVEDLHESASLNGKPAVVIAIQRQPDANTIEVVRQVRDLLPQFRTQVPASIKITPLFDRSVAIRNSVTDVQETLLVTFGLVVLVIFFFLRSARATLIPALAVPLSIIATYAGMALLHFSINNISLLALTLCVGFVVDDAIVMLENIVRHIEAGEKPFAAALRGAREIGFTIVSMTASLITVFIPVLFMGGIVGRTFREFAVTISMTVLFSGLIALTLTPMLCSKLLKGHEHKGKFDHLLEGGFNRLRAGYEAALRVVLDHRLLTLIVTFALLGASIFAFEAAPKGFFPLEDTGFVRVSTEAAQDVSFDAMLEKQRRAQKMIQDNPYVETVFSRTGGGGHTANTGFMFFGLKPRAQRPSVFDIVQDLRKQLASIEGLKVYMQPLQNIQIGGRSSKSMYQYTLQSTDIDGLYSLAQKLMDALSKQPWFEDVTSDMQLDSLEAVVTVDQQKAASLGITYDDVRQALYSAYGNSQIASLYTSSDDYAVIFEVAPKFQTSIEDMSRIYVAGTAAGNPGHVVPLDNIATITRGTAPLSINHQGQMPAVTISFNLADGISLGQAVTRMTQVQNGMHMPANITGSFQGTAQVFQESLAGQGALLGFTIVVIFIILGMLYESFLHPVTILSGLPSAGLGAVITLMIFHMDVSVISVIGIVLLIGIVKKNSIMMVDFAINARKEGASAHDAIFEACILRFRPIMMTTMAAIFGTLPIALALGTGSELRQPLGVAVVGGLLTSQLLTLFITPVVYLYLEKFSDWLRRDEEDGGEEESARPA
ncbi:MAG: MMPL family transporter [Alphaproteobacteria bacterium]|nr:MMPL family transporter [Alphaproteobacteria bacterium]